MIRAARRPPHPAIIGTNKESGSSRRQEEPERKNPGQEPRVQPLGHHKTILGQPEAGINRPGPSCS